MAQMDALGGRCPGRTRSSPAFPLQQNIEPDVRPLPEEMAQAVAAVRALRAEIRQQKRRCEMYKASPDSPPLSNVSNADPVLVVPPPAWKQAAGRLSLAALQILSVAGYLLCLGVTTSSGSDKYHISTTTTMSCVILAVIFLLMEALSGSSREVHLEAEPHHLQHKVIGWSALVGMLWAVFENFNALAVAKAGSATVATVMQTRVFFTAVWRTTLVGAKMTELHWQGVALLLISTVGFNLSQLTDVETADSDVDVLSYSFGVALCVVGAFTSAWAMVLSEILYQDPRLAATSFLMKNAYAQIAKLLTSLVFMLFLDPGVLRDGFFFGWSWATLSVPFMIALRVLAVQLVILYLDALTSAICSIVAVLVVYAVDVSFLGQGFDLTTFVLVLLVLQSVFIFGRIGGQLDGVSREARNGEQVRWLRTLSEVEQTLVSMEATLSPPSPLRPPALPAWGHVQALIRRTMLY